MDLDKTNGDNKSTKPTRPNSLVYSNINNAISIEDEKSLGCGAFGVVWQVNDPRTGEKLALKRIPEVFNSLSSAKRAYRELKILSSIKHDNIICMKDFVKIDDQEGFQEVMVLCEFMQTDLHKIIISKQPLTLDHVKLFIYQILRGIKYLHSSGIMHRDLKPGNLLVNANCLLKICDFGLARTVEPSYNQALSREVVTQYYRSPELLLGINRYSLAIDMWSIGCVLGEMLLRRVLFLSLNPIKHLEMITDLIGTPSFSDLADLSDCPAASFEYLACRPQKMPNHKALALICSGTVDSLVKIHSLNEYNYCEEPNLIPEPDQDLLSLFLGLLSFNPNNRLTAKLALENKFLYTARLRFHTWNCECCPRGGPNQGPSPRTCVLSPGIETKPLRTSKGYPNFRLMPTSSATPMEDDEYHSVSAKNPRNIIEGSCDSFASSRLSSFSKPSPQCPIFPGPGPEFSNGIEKDQGQQTDLKMSRICLNHLNSAHDSNVPAKHIFNGGHEDFFKMKHSSSTNYPNTLNPEPTYMGPNLDTEVEITDLLDARMMIRSLIHDYFQKEPGKIRVMINSLSPNYDNFIKSSVAQYTRVNKRN